MVGQPVMWLVSASSLYEKVPEIKAAKIMFYKKYTLYYNNLYIHSYITS